MLSLLPNNFAVSDPDAGDTVTYQLLIGPHSANFAIRNPDTLSVQQLIDVDNGQITEMSLEVIVLDSGGLQDKTHVTVYITDVNDNGPIFDQSYYTATIPGRDLIFKILSSSLFS